jgi:hypothetical protein
VVGKPRTSTLIVAVEADMAPGRVPALITSTIAISVHAAQPRSIAFVDGRCHLLEPIAPCMGMVTTIVAPVAAAGEIEAHYRQDGDRVWRALYVPLWAPEGTPKLERTQRLACS